MRLPFTPPLAPMLSSAADTLPGGEGWQFEPKWDGFRTLVFRDGDEVLLQSRDEKPMNRYFPELAAPLKAALPERCVGFMEFSLMRTHDAIPKKRMAEALEAYIHHDEPISSPGATLAAPSTSPRLWTSWCAPARATLCRSPTMSAIGPFTFVTVAVAVRDGAHAPHGHRTRPLGAGALR